MDVGQAVGGTILSGLKRLLSVVQRHPKKSVLAALIFMVLQKRMLRRGSSRSTSTRGKERPVADLGPVFLSKFRRLLRIVLPGLWSKEAGILALHTAFLVARTIASIVVARIDGAITKTIVDRNAPQFVWRLVQWIGLAIPATFINSMIKFLETKVRPLR
jgi:ATP-binding cassette subfamily D (ALD) protein 2